MYVRTLFLLMIKLLALIDAPNYDNDNVDDDVNTGAIVGGVVGGVAGVALLILPIILLWFYYIKNKGEKSSTYKYVCL